MGTKMSSIQRNKLSVGSHRFPKLKMEMLDLGSSYFSSLDFAMSCLTQESEFQSPILDFPKESQITIPDPRFPKQIPDPNLGLSITMPNRRKFNQIPEIKESLEDP